jgi:hypothetical protein
MIEFERKEGLITSRPDDNGCRTLLRLHRAMGEL